MVSLDSLSEATLSNVEYRITRPLNIYDSPQCQALATQAIARRHLVITSTEIAKHSDAAVPVILVEDQYPGWLRTADLEHLEVCSEPYQAKAMGRTEIVARLPKVIAYARDAMSVPNQYLWGGTLGPNLDCSGLVQRSYGSQGIWVPRDAYQQEAFTQKVDASLEFLDAPDPSLESGDLIFFGPPQKATHVAIYLGEGNYIHSSGKDQGRNGIGIDSLTNLQHPVSQSYAKEIRGFGRIMTSFCP